MPGGHDSFKPGHLHPTACKNRTREKAMRRIGRSRISMIDLASWLGVTRAFGMGCHSASLAGQAMNRYRGTEAEFQFSIVAPHTAHSKLLISRASAMCSLRS